MRYLLPIFIVTVSIFVASCASVKVFDMPKVEDNLARAFQKSEEISAGMKVDFEQKKILMDQLRKGKSPKFKEIETELKAKLTNMERFLATANKKTKAMMDARGEITSLGYSRKKIRADEPGYERVEESVQAFETSANEFTQAASEYSRVTNSLADVVATKKLFFNFDVAEFQTKAQKSLDSARENAQLMEREVHRTEEIRSSFESEEGRLPVEQALAQMNSIREEHIQRIQALSNSMTEMTNLSKGQSKIPSTTPAWNEVQRVVNDTERTTVTLNELFRDFQMKVDRVRQLKAVKN